MGHNAMNVSYKQTNAVVLTAEAQKESQTCHAFVSYR